MKIAIVCYPTFGGSGVVATELGMALSSRGHEIHFVTYRQPVRLEALNKRLFFHEVHVPEYDLFQYQPYELALSSRLVDVVKQHQIDLLHVHYAIPHAYAAYMAKKMLADQGIHIPLVTTLHGTDITLVGKHPFYKTAVTFSIDHSDAVTAVSESLKRDTISFFNPKREVEVIPNFIDISRYENKEEPCPRSMIVSGEERILTHVSNFRPVKRIIDVLQIFKSVRQRVNAKLLMIGEGPEKSKAQQFVEDNDLDGHVIFLGKSNQIHQILCFTDIFLLPSEQESFGLAALEAMVHEVPVISTDVGGLPEVNISGVSGYLFSVGDTQAMAEKTIEVLQNDSLHQQLKKGAFEQAKAYNLPEVLDQYERLYTRILLNTSYSIG